LEKRELQLAVSTEMFKQQAKVAISKTNPGFKASNGWEQKCAITLSCEHAHPWPRNFRGT